MIYVIATLELEPGSRNAFLAEFAKVVPLVRAEAGCLEYAPAIDAETGMAAQHRIGPDRAMVIERWDSVEALAAHDVAPHMQAYRSRVKALVRSREIRMLTSA
jgi:quinol monooxygenase YgiN